MKLFVVFFVKQGMLAVFVEERGEHRYKFRYLIDSQASVVADVAVLKPHKHSGIERIKAGLYFAAFLLAANPHTGLNPLCRQFSGGC